MLTWLGWIALGLVTWIGWSVVWLRRIAERWRWCHSHGSRPDWNCTNGYPRCDVTPTGRIDPWMIPWAMLLGAIWPLAIPVVLLALVPGAVYWLATRRPIELARQRELDRIEAEYENERETELEEQDRVRELEIALAEAQHRLEQVPPAVLRSIDQARKVRDKVRR